MVGEGSLPPDGLTILQWQERSRVVEIDRLKCKKQFISDRANFQRAFDINMESTNHIPKLTKALDLYGRLERTTDIVSNTA